MKRGRAILDPCPCAHGAGSHPVATVIIDATDQQGLGFGACDRLIIALVVELGLHRVKEIADRGWRSAHQRRTSPLKDDLADVEPIAQKMGVSGPRVNGMPPTVSTVLRDRTLG